jgi:hypothetical protein
LGRPDTHRRPRPRAQRYDTQAVAQGALALGASDVVPKPFDVSAITALVRA